MPKANQYGSTYYVDEGQDLTDVPEGYRLVGPGAPKEETDEKAQPPSEDKDNKSKSEDSGKSDSKSGTLNLKK